MFMIYKRLAKSSLPTTNPTILYANLCHSVSCNEARSSRRLAKSSLPTTNPTILSANLCHSVSCNEARSSRFHRNYHPILMVADFRTVQEAIDAVPLCNKSRVIIQVSPGIYKQPIYIPKTKNLITLAGFRPEDTLLTWNNTATKIEHHQASRVIGTGMFGCGTAIVEGEDFIAENITFENNAPEVDIVDFNGSFLARVRDLVGSNPISLIITKDCFATC